MKVLHLQQWKCYTYLYQLNNSDLNGHQKRQMQHLSAYYPAMGLLHLSTKRSTTYLGVQNTRKRTVRGKTRKSTIKRKQRGLGIFLKWPELSFFEARSEWLFWELNDPSSIHLSFCFSPFFSFLGKILVLAPFECPWTNFTHEHLSLFRFKISYCFALFLQSIYK